MVDLITKVYLPGNSSLDSNLTVRIVTYALVDGGISTCSSTLGFE